jgi:hypothetical protein
MLDLQPTLTGTHITLRPLAAPDFDELFVAASDPLIWAQHPDPGRGGPRRGTGRGSERCGREPAAALVDFRYAIKLLI